MGRLTRAEAQQRTKDVVLGAAEELFLDKGYAATTVAQIADAAGRTQGSIYANFSGKEDLCLQILERHATEIADRVVDELAEVGPEPENKLSVLLRTWKVLADDAGLVTLAAEYVIATRHDPEQRAMISGQLDILRALLAAGVDDNLAVAVSQERVERAAMAVAATVAGLAFGQATGILTAAETLTILEDTLRIWFASVQNDEIPG